MNPAAGALDVLETARGWLLVCVLSLLCLYALLVFYSLTCDSITPLIYDFLGTRMDSLTERRMTRRVFVYCKARETCAFHGLWSVRLPYALMSSRRYISAKVALYLDDLSPM